VTETIALASGFIAAVLCFYLTRTLRLSVALGTTAIIIALISPHFLARPLMFYIACCHFWISVILESRTVPLGRGGRPLRLSGDAGMGQYPCELHVWPRDVLLFLRCLHSYRAFATRDSRNLYRLVLLIGAVSAAAVATPYGS